MALEKGDGRLGENPGLCGEHVCWARIKGEALDLLKEVTVARQGQKAGFPSSCGCWVIGRDHWASKETAEYC